MRLNMRREGWIWVSVSVFTVKWRDSFSVHSTPDALRSALTSERLTQAAGQKRAALHGAAVVPEEKSLQRGSNRCSQLVSLSHSSLHLSTKLCARLTHSLTTFSLCYLKLSELHFSICSLQQDDCITGKCSLIMISNKPYDSFNTQD